MNIDFFVVTSSKAAVLYYNNNRIKNINVEERTHYQSFGGMGKI
jgi:hypothetical protein